MAENKAAQELAALTQATQGTADQAQRMAAQDREAGTAMGKPQAYDRDGDGEASYAVPEGIATAVAAGFILGPVGGAVMGLAQAWLGKQERQNILDQWAEDNDTWDNVQGVLNERLDNLSSTATNSNDLEQLGAFRAQQDAALKLVRSANPNMQQRGIDMLSNIDTEVNDYTERQETQRIEQEAIDAQIARELTAEQRTLFRDELNRFDDQSENYLATIEKANEIRAQLRSGNPATLAAAIVGVVKLQDPTSAAMEGEVGAWRSVGNLTDKFMGYVNQLDEGRPLTTGQAEDLNTLVDNIVTARKEMQLNRQSRVRDRLDALEVPEKYWQEFDIVGDYPAVQRRPIEWRSGGEDVAEEAQQVGNQMAEDGGNILDAARGVVTDGLESVSNWFNDQKQTTAFQKEFYRIHGRYPTAEETNPGVN